MNDLARLLRAVSQNPDEDTPRLIYADALDEVATTDAERARAEFIRLEVGFERWRGERPVVESVREAEPEWARREELRAKYETAWFSALPHMVFNSGWKESSISWARGFPKIQVELANIGRLRATAKWDFVPSWLAWACDVVREGGSFKVTDAGRYLAEDVAPHWWRDEAVYDHDTLPNILTPTASENIFDSVEDAYEWLSRKVTALVCREAWKETK